MRKELGIVVLWAILNLIVIITKRETIKIIDIETTVICIYSLIFLYIAMYCIFIKGTINTYRNVKNVVTSTNKRLHIFSITVTYCLFSILNYLILEKPNISSILTISNIMYLLLITVFSSFYYDEKITMRRIISFILLTISVFLLQ